MTSNISSRQLSSSMCRIRRFLAQQVLAASLVLMLIGCAQAPPEPETGPEPIVNEQLNLSFPKVPQHFEVDINSGSQLELRVKDGIEIADGVAKTGRMWVTVDERSDFGIDLVGIMQGQKDEFLALEGGSFSGSQQLGTPSGLAYYSRGQFDVDGARQEETRVHMVHPTENRLVTFYYRYPPGEDSGERVQELLVWVGELEPAASSDAADSEDPGEPADPADATG